MIPSHSPSKLSSFPKLAIFSFGMSAGVSFFAIASVLMFRLASDGVSPGTIGTFAFVGIPYNLRALWPFLINHVKIPYLSARFAQNKAWGLLAQIVASTCFIALGFVSPAENLTLTFAVAFCLSFFSSIHDVVSDAYRFSFLRKLSHEDSVPLQTIGFRVGQLLSSAFLPILATFCSWSFAHVAVVCVKLFAITTIFCIKEPATKGEACKCAKMQVDAKPLEEKGERPPSSCSAIYGDAVSVVKRLSKRRFVPVFICSIVFIRIIDTVNSALQPMLLGYIGLPALKFGFVKGWFGAMCVMTGIPFASFLVKKFGILKALLGGIIGQSIACTLSMLLLKWQTPVFVGGVTFIQDFFQGIMNTLLIIYISSFCKGVLNVYQFTIFSTISSVSRTLATYTLNIMSNYIGWNAIFCVPLICCGPVTVLLAFLSRRAVFGLAWRKGEDRGDRS